MVRLHSRLAQRAASEFAEPASVLYKNQVKEGNGEHVDPAGVVLHRTTVREFLRGVLVPWRGGVFERSADHAAGSQSGVCTRSVEIPRISISNFPLALWASGARQSGATKRKARPERARAKALRAAGA
jgi:hypothetical protein